MGFFEGLIKIQNAPARKRKAILFFSVIIIMSLILTTWIYQISDESRPKNDDTSNIENPLTLIWSISKKAFNSIKGDADK